MSTYGSVSLKIELTDAGDVLRDISVFVRTFNGIEVENLTQEGQGFSEAWIKNLFTGMNKMGDINLDGFYDDAANTPVSLYVAGASRRLKVTWGSTKTTTLPVMMSKFNRSPKVGELTQYMMTLKHGGTAAALPPVET